MDAEEEEADGNRNVVLSFVPAREAAFESTFARDARGGRGSKTFPSARPLHEEKLGKFV